MVRRYSQLMQVAVMRGCGANLEVSYKDVQDRQNFSSFGTPGCSSKFPNYSASSSSVVVHGTSHIVD